MFDVMCLGILVADVIAKPVSKLPKSGTLQPIDSLTLHTGGCATNTCIDLCKIGINTAIMGNVGKDGFGSYLIDSLNKQGANTEGLVVKKGVNTSASVVTVSPEGERSFFHCIGSNRELTYDDVNFDLIKNSKILFIAGTNLMPKFDGIPSSRVLKKAKEMGVYTAMDTTWDATGKWMETVKPCLPYLDLFIPSYDEAKEIAKKEDPEDIADVFIESGVKLAVIKLGKDGCFIKTKEGEKHYIPTYTQIKRVDATGAGDSFVAGFLTGIIKGWPVKKCGIFANAVGTHCIMEVGASTGIKSMDEILHFIDNNKLE